MTIELLSSISSQLDSAPTPRHLVAYLRKKFAEAGFTERTDKFMGGDSPGFVTFDGSLIAWRPGTSLATSGFRIVGAHTDSPCLRIKPNPSENRHGFSTLLVEIYGSPLLNSWLDRDLGIAGHAALKSGETRLFSSNKPLARISQLAIHLDREVNERGLTLDKQLHLSPAWSTGDSTADFKQWVAKCLDLAQDEILQIEAQLFDTAKASALGSDDSLLVSGRLDNQASCWAAVNSLIAAERSTATQVIALFDHEEVGSESASGAAGPLLEHTLERIAADAGLSRTEFLSVLPLSTCVSADNAHAVHHNYPERHDMANAPIINRGPAVKINSNQRYATSAESAGTFIEACNRAKVPHQVFSSRNNIPCGSTIGPITATRLGIRTVDVGVPQLSMHSAREVCGVKDLDALRRALTAFLC